MQEFPHALPFRQYLQHGWTVSFAFPFLDDGMSSSDGEGGALVARRASAKLSLPPETVATTTTMLISFRIRRFCRQPAWDSYLESSAAPIARPQPLDLAQEFGVSSKSISAGRARGGEGPPRRAGLPGAYVI